VSTPLARTHNKANRAAAEFPFLDVFYASILGRRRVYTSFSASVVPVRDQCGRTCAMFAKTVLRKAAYKNLIFVFCSQFGSRSEVEPYIYNHFPANVLDLVD